MILYVDDMLYNMLKCIYYAKDLPLYPRTFREKDKPDC